VGTEEGKLMRRGRKPSEQYADVLTWLTTKAKIGEAYVWSRFKTEVLAREGMRRLSSCLRTQVELQPGIRYGLRRSMLPDGRCEVVVFLFQEPTTIVRVQQGQKA